MDFNTLKKLLIKEIILSKNVFIVGHNNLDIDAYASIMGFSLLCKKLRKEYFIITNDKVLDYGIIKTQAKMKQKKINPVEINEKYTSKSLLIILDTNKSNLICLNNLEKFKKVIIIDHHDINKNTIKTDYKYINKKSSSASEIITMLLRELKVKIPKNYCTLLLAGIILDTNGLSYKLNKKTFYNCYYLLSKGADMNEAQELLKEGQDDYLRKCKLIEKAEIKNNIALTIGTEAKIYKRRDLATTADTLLTFRGVKASIVIGRLSKTDIGISARSISEINVNKLMNNLGGGGNENEAATVLKDVTIQEAKEKILQIIKR